jgi:hypothetical protein
MYVFNKYKNQLGFKPKKYGYLLSFKDNAIDHSATDWIYKF